MNLGELKGQHLAVELLTRAIALEQIAPAYLFTGNSGIGRRLATLGFTRLLLSGNAEPKDIFNHPDLLWIEPTYLHQGKLITVKEALANSISRKTAPQIRIEQIREIMEFLGRPPLLSPRSVIVIEDAHQMNESAANALLKTLEEPGLATLILIVNSSQSLLSTLVSRCQRIPFYRLSDSEVVEILTEKGYTEIINQPEIITLAQGSPGKAIALAEQFQTIPPELLTKLKTPPYNLTSIFTLAQTITQELDTENQLWLIDYLQVYYWRSSQKDQIALIWEQARQFLQQYVNPRLVWECSLLELYKQWEKVSN
ncbi:MAG: DNA polymerase III subunit delta' [Gloeocapsa sp. DLM2.Bin57]|nr:MAG: DNA polymerase III subunit delta' [Gloeocapsa sp. DLM2.Bin57]